MLHEAVAVADDQAAEMLASTTASVCRMYHEDRNERAVLSLVRAADALMERLGRRHAALFGLRLWHAAALLAQGDHEQARFGFVEAAHAPQRPVVVLPHPSRIRPPATIRSSR